MIKALNALDPDQWYRGSQKLHERRQVLPEFEKLKGDNTAR